MAPDPTDNRDFIGSIDRAVIAFGLAVLSLIPTILTSIFRPSRLWPLIEGDLPKGRNGVILSPGIFFLLSTAFFSLLLSLASGDGSGVEISQSVKAAVIGGNVGKILLSLAPLFALAIFWTILSWSVTKPILKDWTVLHATKTGFYLAGTMLWVLIVIEQVTLVFGDFGTRTRASGIAILLAVFVFCWFLSVFKAFKQNQPKEAILASGSLAGIWAVVVFFNY